MISRSDKRITCVYLLGFKQTHKVYVGSSEDWPRRYFSGHLSTLRYQKHGNPYLQNAYNKYGEENLMAEVLEVFTDELSMRYGEQKWMAYYFADEKEYGYNIVKDTMRRGRTGCKLTPEQRQKMSIAQRKARKEHPERFDGKPRGAPKDFVLFDPSGQEVRGKNLYKFCRERGLDHNRMSGVADGGTVEYNGWKLRPDRVNEHHVAFHLISPDEEHFTGRQLNQFCREKGLPLASMSHMWNGRMKTCKGWRRFDTPLPQALIYKGIDHVLINPQGEEVKINNLKGFCRMQNIKYEVIRKGYCNSGWRLKS